TLFSEAFAVSCTVKLIHDTPFAYDLRRLRSTSGSAEAFDRIKLSSHCFTLRSRNAVHPTHHARMFTHLVHAPRRNRAPRGSSATGEASASTESRSMHIKAINARETQAYPRPR